MSFENPFYILLHLGAFAFAMSLAVSGFMLSAGLLDAPVSRSNHKNPTPTAGGLGVVSGLGIGLLALALFYPYLGNVQVLGQISALALAVSLLGLVDDVHDIGAKGKLFILLLLSCACVYVIGAPMTLPFAAGAIDVPTWLGFGGAVLWVFVVMNTVNFMDGINGIMGWFMVVAFAGLALVSIVAGAFTPAILSVLMISALAGFLPYNARNKALIFCGDVGALLTGFMFAATSLMLVVDKAPYGLLYAAPLLILPFLADVILTVVARARRKDNILSAHKSHIYQRLVHSGRSHIFVAALYAGSGLFMVLITLVGVRTGLIRSVFFLSFWVFVAAAVYMVLEKTLKTSEPDQRQTPPSP